MLSFSLHPVVRRLSPRDHWLIMNLQISVRKSVPSTSSLFCRFRKEVKICYRLPFGHTFKGNSPFTSQIKM